MPSCPHRRDPPRILSKAFSYKFAPHRLSFVSPCRRIPFPSLVSLSIVMPSPGTKGLKTLNYAITTPRLLVDTRHLTVCAWRQRKPTCAEFCSSRRRSGTYDERAKKDHVSLNEEEPTRAAKAWNPGRNRTCAPCKTWCSATELPDRVAPTSAAPVNARRRTLATRNP